MTGSILFNRFSEALNHIVIELTQIVIETPSQSAVLIVSESTTFGV